MRSTTRPDGFVPWLPWHASHSTASSSARLPCVCWGMNPLRVTHPGAEARRSLVTIAVRDGPTFVCATTADHLASDVVEILPEQLAQLYRDLGCDPSSPNSPGD